MTCVFVEDLGMILPNENSPKKYRYYSVICPFCGEKFNTRAGHYKSGKLVSCRGCSSGIRDNSIYHRKHGLRKSPLYHVWSGIKSRCNNQSHDAYKNYGGRGISICREWSEDFEKFHDWSMKNGYRKGLDIDRKNNDGNYEPSNCRYVTRFVNCSNTQTLRSTNTTGFRGVFKYGKSDRFYAKLRIDGKCVNLGVFGTKEKASEVYEKARKEKYFNL